MKQREGERERDAVSVSLQLADVCIKYIPVQLGERDWALQILTIYQGCEDFGSFNKHSLTSPELLKLLLTFQHKMKLHIPGRAVLGVLSVNLRSEHERQFHVCILCMF